MKTVGYYVHHHGTGHMRRALNISKHMSSKVVLFSSMEKPSDIPQNVVYVQLPSDVVDEYEPTPYGFTHYTPYSSKIFERNERLIAAWKKHDVKHIYVDVSIEVAILARLFGLTVGYAIMHGNRTDKGHTYAYGISEYLLAHASERFDDTQERTSDTHVYYTGGISRYKKVAPTPVERIGSVAILQSPTSERATSKELFDIALAHPEVTWHVVGPEPKGTMPNNVKVHGIVTDPEQIIHSADAVIAAAGNNTIMELASLAKPFICIPEDRPYDEQVSAAECLHSLNAAVYKDSFPNASDWEECVRRLKSVGLSVLSSLVDDDSSINAARILDSHAI